MKTTQKINNMKSIKFNEETGDVIIQTETGFEVLNRLHQNTEYTDYTSFYTIKGKTYV